MFISNKGEVCVLGQSVVFKADWLICVFSSILERWRKGVLRRNYGISLNQREGGLYLLMLNESSRLLIYVSSLQSFPPSFRHADQTVICSFERWLGIFACISSSPACRVPTPGFGVEEPFVNPDYAPHPKRLVVTTPCSSSCHISICSLTHQSLSIPPS